MTRKVSNFKNNEYNEINVNERYAPIINNKLLVDIG